ncbi:MAG: SH3 domain-containing protein [Candidatus Acidiferrales bacterium]
MRSHKLSLLAPVETAPENRVLSSVTRTFLFALLTLIPLAMNAQQKQECTEYAWPDSRAWELPLTDTGSYSLPDDPKALASAKSIYIKWDDSISEPDKQVPGSVRWSLACQSSPDLRIYVRKSLSASPIAPRTVILTLIYDGSGRLVFWDRTFTVGSMWSDLQAAASQGDRILRKGRDKEYKSAFPANTQVYLICADGDFEVLLNSLERTNTVTSEMIYCGAVLTSLGKVKDGYVKVRTKSGTVGWISGEYISTMSAAH